MDLVRQSFGITLVFVLLWAALWWLKRRGIATMGFRLNSPASSRQLESIERLVLSPQHSVHLVRVKDEILLLGLHPAGMSVLSQPSRPAVLKET